MPNRKVSPPIHQITHLTLPRPRIHTLRNGIRLYEVSMGTQDVVRLDLVFRSGRPYEHNRLTSWPVSALLREGTPSYSAARIAEEMDFYGASLQAPFNLDTGNLSLYTLTRYFDKLLPLVTEMATQPLFPESEIRAFAKRNKQRLQVDLTRNDVVAYRLITERIFGANHPYGYNTLPADYDQISREALMEHFTRTHTASNCTIFLSGKTDDSLIERIDQYLGQAIPQGPRVEPVIDNILQPPQTIHQPHPDSLQCAIRIGRRLFPRSHPDYAGLYVLNTILGGYFGSRLMANIREEKGFTYNIYSSLDPMQYDGYFYVATEVGNASARDALREIYREMENLQRKKIGREEMSMVRNYLMGNLLTMIDGPFNVVELVRAVVLEELADDAFEALSETILTITPARLQELAQIYFRKEDMFEIVVGNPEG